MNNATEIALELPFDVSEYHARLAKVREGMKRYSIDVLLLTGPENIYYLSGYHTTGYHVYQSLLIPLTGEACFVLRRLELGNARRYSWIADTVAVEDNEDPIVATVERIRQFCAAEAHIGYEDRASFLPPATLSALQQALPNARWLGASGIVEAVRVLKSPAEIALLRRAAVICSKAVEDASSACVPGASENDVAAILHASLIHSSSEYTGSPPYVTAAPHSALSHATYAGNMIDDVSHVWIECGASLHRYHAGVGRNVRVGKPTREFVRLLDIVQRAQDSMIAALRPGALAGHVDRAGRSVAEEAGVGQYWLHRGGYSIGISFPPGLGEGHIMDIKPGDPRRIEVGMAFHIVPIVLVPGVGAVGCTDTVLISGHGSEVLTTAGRDLVGTK